LRFSAAPHKSVARAGPVFAPAMWCLRTTAVEIETIGQHLRARRIVWFCGAELLWALA
jgi:hypothetical protein